MLVLQPTLRSAMALAKSCLCLRVSNLGASVELDMAGDAEGRFRGE